MSRKALIVGINYYESLSKLFGCVNDAYKVKGVLERNGDASLNFDVKLRTADNVNQILTARELKNDIKELFDGDSDIALFYFAGHGYSETIGGYILTSESNEGDEGISLNYLMRVVNASKAKNKIIILDSCQSGSLGTDRTQDGESIMAEGVTILTASAFNQYASEEDNTGVFTSLLVDALSGGASNILGHITPGSVYAYIDQSLGPWDQRPVFKTNVKSFVVLRSIQSFVSLDEIRRLNEFFPTKHSEFNLDPSFEPDSKSPVEENNKVFKILQNFNRVNLVVPVGEEHMYYAAMNSKSCKLTVLGEHYWNLINKNRI